jgi:hypothetical protein
MNIIRSSTLKPVGYCCSELKKLGADGGIKMFSYTSLTGGMNKKRYLERFKLK